MPEEITHIAIDPGANGVIVLRRANGSIEAHKMPECTDLQAIGDILLSGGTLNPDAKVFIEKVGYHMMGNNASSSVKLAKHVGLLRGLVFGILWRNSREEVPQKWMKHFGKMPNDKKDRKNKLKALAQKLHPKLRVTLWSADGLLMMKYMLDKEQEERTNAKSNA